MSIALNNIITKQHDKEACKQNRKENGKIFNHEPHPCLYYTGCDKYNELLSKIETNDIDDPDSISQLEKEQEKEQLIEFLVKVSEYGDMDAEVQLGCRKQEDVMAMKVPLENL